MDPFRPTVSGLIPADWFAKESLTLLHPDGRANVIASSEPLPSGVDTEQYAHTQGQLLDTEFPDYVLHAFEPMLVFGGRRGRVRRFSWTPPEGVQVTQVQIYYVEAERGYTATATTPSSEYAELELELWEILEGLSIDDAAAGRRVTAGQAKGDAGVIEPYRPIDQSR